MKSSSIREAVYAFIDVETTGLDPRNDRIVEVACRVMRGTETLACFDSLVNPERAIPAVASAIHHITSADTAAAPRLETIAPTLRAMCADAVIVAHNARFDLAFLPFLAGRPVLCSMRFAMHVIHDAPNFKNQVLRYHLGLGAALFAGTAAHRALGDVFVTSEIFAVCLQRYLARGGADDLQTLIATVNAPRPRAALPFTSGVNEDARFTVLQELDRRSSSVA